MPPFLALRPRFLAALTAVALSASGLTGCGSNSDATARVTGVFNTPGRQLDGYRVRFYADDIGVGALAQLEPDGRFAFDSELPPGSYVVTVLPPEEAPPTADAVATVADRPVVPHDYMSESKSPLAAHVVPGQNEFEFTMPQ